MTKRNKTGNIRKLIAFITVIIMSFAITSISFAGLDKEYAKTIPTFTDYIGMWMGQIDEEYTWYVDIAINPNKGNSKGGLDYSVLCVVNRYNQIYSMDYDTVFTTVIYDLAYDEDIDMFYLLLDGDLVMKMKMKGEQLEIKSMKGTDLLVLLDKIQ